MPSPSCLLHPKKKFLVVSLSNWLMPNNFFFFKIVVFFGIYKVLALRQNSVGIELTSDDTPRRFGVFFFLLNKIGSDSKSRKCVNSESQIIICLRSNQPLQSYTLSRDDTHYKTLGIGKFPWNCFVQPLKARCMA